MVEILVFTKDENKIIDVSKALVNEDYVITVIDSGEGTNIHLVGGIVLASPMTVEEIRNKIYA